MSIDLTPLKNARRLLFSVPLGSIRFALRTAFSMAAISDGSNGCATMSVGSGMDSEAT